MQSSLNWSVVTGYVTGIPRGWRKDFRRKVRIQTGMTTDSTNPQPVLTLAIETSTKTGRAALFWGAEFWEERVCEFGSSTAQSIFPLIADLLKAHQKKAPDIGKVAVTTGPGSFTGLRVGVTLAKTIAFANPCEIVGVNTLQVLAHQCFQIHEAAAVRCVIDAQRKQLFAATFIRENVEMVKQVEIVDNDQLTLEENCFVTGAGLERMDLTKFESNQVANRDVWQATARATGELALCRPVDSVLELEPHYFRRSAAEEKIT